MGLLNSKRTYQIFAAAQTRRNKRFFPGELNLNLLSRWRQSLNDTRHERAVNTESLCLANGKGTEDSLLAIGSPKSSSRPRPPCVTTAYRFLFA